ncbi:hypothetical protein [Scytonema sp. PRP1]|uniref:hypothetical protein n=1 Tax=Scytonema sp. PRP1 TaxID=3120513 RepID=UPI00300C0013
MTAWVAYVLGYQRIARLKSLQLQLKSRYLHLIAFSSRLLNGCAVDERECVSLCDERVQRSAYVLLPFFNKDYLNFTISKALTPITIPQKLLKSIGQEGKSGLRLSVCST